jgi:hypothetical protein
MTGPAASVLPSTTRTRAVGSDRGEGHIMKRIKTFARALAMTGALAISAGGAPAFAAVPDAGNGVGAGAAPAAAQTMADHGGCNHWTCVGVRNFDGWYCAYANYIPSAGGGPGVLDGHFHIWGPGLDTNSPDKRWLPHEQTACYQGRGSGAVCAEGWTFVAGRWESEGLACETV